MVCRTVQSSLAATGEELCRSSGDGTDVAPGMVPDVKSKRACTATLGKEAFCEAKSVESPYALARTPADSALASVPAVARSDAMATVAGAVGRWREDECTSNAFKTSTSLQTRNRSVASLLNILGDTSIANIMEGPAPKPAKFLGGCPLSTIVLPTVPSMPRRGGLVAKGSSRTDVRRPEEDRYDAWERGEMDYMGVDAFVHIQRKLDRAIKGPPSGEKHEKDEESLSESTYLDVLTDT
ncbi:hypothetical protein HPB51_018998 [Rhipicephalus microplus]|uniref:Uncharacterized protein n=1 Tax=Rhipicephalus microplus TaxID=6941 RepID=A0A9J6D798_RHIMP|nr:hypothetical protein HPB51_018998 [Rhipicephalus microplus]